MVYGYESGLEKTYDRLEWNFIMDTLFDLSIPGRLVNVIMKCLASTSMQICWNGSYPSLSSLPTVLDRGIPLAPTFLFCARNDYLILLAEKL